MQAAPCQKKQKMPDGRCIARRQCVDGAIEKTIHAKQCKCGLSDDLLG